MSIDGGVRNTTMLLLLMCIPLLVASCQHTFGLGSQITASNPVEEPEPDVLAAIDADAVEKVAAKPTAVSESELLVSVADEPASRDDATTADADTIEPLGAQLTADSGTEPAGYDRVSGSDETAVQSEEALGKDEGEVVASDATAEFEEWSVTLDDNIRIAVLREITVQLEKATADFDRQQAQLENLRVETELYKMQIQHLLNRRREWEAGE